MPNWCEGSLKLRGEKENIMKFFKEGLDVTAPDERAGRSIEEFVDFDEDCVVIDGVVYINDTSRAFIEPSKFYWNEEGGLQLDSIIFKQAWDIEPEDFLSIAKKYNIDIRIQAFEKGMEFARDVEIVDGEITKDETIRYDDYIWDCPMPNMGG